MNIETIRKLLASSNEEDVEIGVELLLNNYTREEIRDAVVGIERPFKPSRLCRWITTSEYSFYIGYTCYVIHLKDKYGRYEN